MPQIPLKNWEKFNSFALDNAASGAVGLMLALVVGWRLIDASFEDQAAINLSASNALGAVERRVTSLEIRDAEREKQYTDSALLIADRLNSNRIFTSELFEEINNRLERDKIEMRIDREKAELRSENIEIERLSQIMQGVRATPPSDEIGKSLERSRLRALELQDEIEKNERRLDEIPQRAVGPITPATEPQ